jgi:hypothetical protein
LNIHRQSVCDVYRKHPLTFVLSNFAIFYPPYIDILVHIMKTDKIIYGLAESVFSEIFLELDLRPFIRLIQPDNVEIHIWFTFRTKKINLVVNSPPNKYLTLVYYNHSTYILTLTMSSQLTETMNRSMIKNDVLCYNFISNLINNETQIDEPYVTCPPDKCLTDESETRSCIGSIPCHRTGSTSLLCQIDRLRSNDQFNVHTSFLYSDLIIITTDNHKQTLQHLVKICSNHVSLSVL